MEEKWGIDNISVSLFNDSTVLIKGEGQSGTDIRLTLTVPKTNPLLDVSIKTKYSKSTIVNRETLVLAFDVPVNEVYLKNRQIDTSDFDSEYWLQKQGVRLGKGDRSALIYNTAKVSSLQMDTKRNLLFVNLDYYLDHLFFKVPYNEANGARWVDQSPSEYLSGDEREERFSVYFGEVTKHIPRIMLVPDGYLAGYIFTEHADGGTLNTNRAAYFGSEDISDVSKATGGFAKHKIPVTKSVFYNNSDTGAYSSITGDPEFLDFLDQLNSSGMYEICLHTPENLNSNRKIMEESIKFMNDRFETVTWIDHGMMNGRINRETIVADGLNPASEFYSADLWEKYNTQYFWNAAVEEIRNYSLREKVSDMKFYEASLNMWRRYLSPGELRDKPFYSAFVDLGRIFNGRDELNSLLPAKGNAFPTPLYWQHPTRTGKFYLWTTEYDMQYRDLSLRKVKEEEVKLDKLISEWGVFINHGYFVRNIKNVDILIEDNGKFMINPFFDKMLENMGTMRDDGKLYVSTMRELMNYWIMTGNISFDFLPDGSVKLHNNNDGPINGLSMAVRSTSVLVDGKVPAQKSQDDDIIFWFDIPSGGDVILSFPSL